MLESSAMPEFACLGADPCIPDNVLPVLFRIQIQRGRPSGLEVRVDVLELRIIESVPEAAQVPLPFLGGITEDENPIIHFHGDLDRLAVPEDGSELRSVLRLELP